MKLEVGMYIRLINDVENVVIIHKIAQIFDNTILTENDGSIYQGEYTKENILKASHNIIDLIEKGDIIKTCNDDIYQVINKEDNYLILSCQDENGIYKTATDYQIKSIVTKEQFESMSYKVGE